MDNSYPHGHHVFMFLPILSLFSIKLTQKIRIAGESASQALLTGNK